MNFLNRLSLAQKVALVVSSVLFVFLLLAAVSFYAFQRRITIENSEERLQSQVEDLQHMFLAHYREQRKRLERIQEASLNLLKINNQPVENDIVVQAFDMGAKEAVEITFRPYQPRELYRLVVGQNMHLQVFQKIDGGYVNITNRSAGLNVEKYIFIPNNQAPFTYEADTQVKSNVRFDSLDVILISYIPCRLGLTDYGFIQLEVVVDMSLMYDLLEKKSYYTNGYAYVINNEGTVIAHPNKSYLMLKPTDDPDYQKFFSKMQATRVGNYVLTSRLHKEPKICFYHYIEPYQLFLVIVVTYADMIDQSLNPIIRFMAVVFGVIVLINVLISYNFVNRLLNPVKQILHALNSISRGDFQLLQDTNRKDEVGDLTRALNKAIMGLENATLFAADIGKQRYDTPFEPLSKDDKLGNALLVMRDALKSNAEQEAERRVLSEALTHFADLIRKTGADLQALCQQTLSEMVRFLNAQQGCLYLAETDADEQICLTSVATFADGRKKFKQDRVLANENLVGQVFLEKQSLRIDKLPPNYFSIASGLGSTPPSCLMITPIKQGEQVVGVIEIASLQTLTEKQQGFVERIGEILAASIISAQNNEKMRKMLIESQMLAENLRAQEEEMRQNMEELQATQEELQRQTYQSKIFTDAVNRCSIIIEFDKNATITYVNPLFEEVTGFSYKEIVGQKHTYYVPPEVIQSGAFEQLWADLSKGKHIFRDVFRMKKNGERFWLRASYMPIFENGDLQRISCICFDVTEERKREAKILAELEELRRIVRDKSASEV